MVRDRGGGSGGALVTAPKRIQRQRTKGWRMPEGAVYVGRPTKWGNPFVVGHFSAAGGAVIWVDDRAHAAELFRERTHYTVRTGPAIKELRGKDLVCWCPLEDADGNRVPCHADVLLEWANS